MIVTGKADEKPVSSISDGRLPGLAFPIVRLVANNRHGAVLPQPVASRG
jgi:hypothetical protein